MDQFEADSPKKDMACAVKKQSEDVFNSKLLFLKELQTKKKTSSDDFEVKFSS